MRVFTDNRLSRGVLLLAAVGAISVGTIPATSVLAGETTFSGTYSTFGTYKANPVGKERVLVVWDENGVTLSNGPLDRVTWHCWGTHDFIKGVGQAEGYCIGTDPGGDQIVATLRVDRHTPDDKTRHGSFTYTSGTGKFAGVSGDAKLTFPSEDLRTGADGTYAVIATMEGKYTLP
jgi:hypothetical protein